MKKVSRHTLDIFRQGHFLCPFTVSVLIMVFASIPQNSENLFFGNLLFAVGLYAAINLSMLLVRRPSLLRLLSFSFKILGQGRMLISSVLVILYVKLHNPSQAQNIEITDALALGLVACFLITAFHDAVRLSNFCHNPATLKSQAGLLNEQ